MSTPPAPLAALLQDPQRHLAGTDVQIVLPLGRNLLNEVLDARPPDTPVKELFLDPDEGNLTHLHLAVKAPVIGTVKRRLTLRPGAPVSFPDQPWLRIDIVDGFKFMDKPVIRVMQSTIAEKLPKGIEITSDYIRLHVPALLTAAGYQPLVPLIKRLQLEAGDNRLVLTLHLLAS